VGRAEPALPQGRRAAQELRSVEQALLLLAENAEHEIAYRRLLVAGVCFVAVRTCAA
jgi:hypothetical protein